MNIELAKKRISELQNYVDLTETYVADCFEKHIIKEYAITGSVVKVAEKMNELGFKIGERKVESNDVSAVINTNPSKNDDELHRIVRRLYRNKLKSHPYL
ncbi:hypothetical protein BGM26_02985 [Bacillus sp. FJAT-29790]|uniref:hypothetical protein n=1 Tax=Bacillus sp. FJAT-29790 TaxID=1895002 RepID=UPI001C214BB4|nr:hypothetical protein [Bacillus sp. FJAT-29790]MBU8877957.1 hypothetical protein [Bacillus sp. FJAT-29790]